MKKNNYYFENVKNMMINLINVSEFNCVKATENFQHLWFGSSYNGSDIVYEDYVKENCPYFTMKDEESRFDTKHWEIVKWIVDEGELETITFMNDNEENIYAMALLDAVQCHKYHNDLRNAKSWI